MVSMATLFKDGKSHDRPIFHSSDAPILFKHINKHRSTSTPDLKPEPHAHTSTSLPRASARPSAGMRAVQPLQGQHPHLPPPRPLPLPGPGLRGAVPLPLRGGLRRRRLPVRRGLRPGRLAQSRPDVRTERHLPLSEGMTPPGPRPVIGWDTGWRRKSDFRLILEGRMGNGRFTLFPFVFV